MRYIFHIGQAYDEFDKDCVRVHNQLRALHNASALCWSESLARDAQKWAESLAYRDRAEHDYQDLITKGQGENIAWMAKTVEKCQGPRKPGCISCGDIVEKWYSEEKNYDFQKAAPVDAGQPVRHFNQVTLKIKHVFAKINDLRSRYETAILHSCPVNSSMTADHEDR